ncbi:MAG: arsenate reductase family protein [Calditrichaceae bacterium]|nr:arsenate reductase family protein [Calditrichaceae bacterium]
MIKLYGVSSCNKIRDAKVILESNKIEYQFINVKKNPIPENQLNEIIEQLGIKKVLNKQGLTYKKLGLNQMNLNDTQLMQWLLKEQGMIKRPLFENNDRYLIDSDEQTIIEFCN